MVCNGSFLKLISNSTAEYICFNIFAIICVPLKL